jgi:hypothetical protein
MLDHNGVGCAFYVRKRAILGSRFSMATAAWSSPTSLRRSGMPLAAGSAQDSQFMCDYPISFLALSSLAKFLLAGI